MNNRLTDFFMAYRLGWNRALREDSDGMAASRRGVFGCNLSTYVTSILTSGVFYTALMLLILKDATTEEYGYFLALRAAVVSVAGLTQFVAPFFLERLKTRRWAVDLLMGVYHLINLLLMPLIVYLPLTVSGKGYLFVVLTGLMTVSSSLCAPAWGVWSMHSLPVERRSDYLMIYRCVCDVLGQALTLLASVFMDYFEARSAAMTGILIMRGVSILMVWSEYTFRRRAVEPVYNAGHERIRLRDILLTPFSSKKFLATVLVASIWGFACAFAAVYYSAYLLDGAKLSYSYMGVVGLAGVPLGLITMPIWNRMIHRMGWMRALPIGMMLYGMAYLFNGFVTEQSQWMYLVSTVFCMAVCGIMALETENLPYLYLPREMSASCLAFYRLCGNLATLAAAAAASWVYGLTSGITIRVFGLTLVNSAYMSIMSFGMVLVGVLIAWLIGRRTEAEQA